MQQRRVIFLTGASSGIGAGLAQRYAEPGVTLGLAARRKDRLAAVARRCRSLGASVHTYAVDVTDGEEVERAAKAFLRRTRQIDLVIANAGLGGWPHPLHADVATMTRMVDVNVNGVIHTITPFLAQMVKQGQGHIVAISSVASFRGLPGGVYAATKAAVRYLMDGWRIDLSSHGITVSTVFPGFVESEMTSRGRRYPFLVPTDRAADLIKFGIDRRYRYFVLPWQWWLLVPVMKLAPDWFFQRRS